MSGFRARALVATVAVAGVLVMTLRGQTEEPRFVVLQGVGLPAIDEGAIRDESHTPASPQAVQKRALLAALSTDRVSSSGSRYRSDRLIVKFRDAAATTDRRAA